MATYNGIKLTSDNVGVRFVIRIGIENCKLNFIETTIKKSLIADSLFIEPKVPGVKYKNIPGIKQDAGFIMKVLYTGTPPEGGGITIVNVSLTSGKYCSVQLVGANNLSIESIDKLPPSLKFDSKESTISGVPLLCGLFVSTVTLSNNTTVSLSFNVIPSSINIGV